MRPNQGVVERPLAPRRGLPWNSPALTAAILHLPDTAATERLACAVAPSLVAGDVVALVGDLGSGKSVFARALIGHRLRALGRHEEIPSPTFTLVQCYDLGEIALWHADLYRLDTVEDTSELGLEEAFDTGICVVEWADRLGAALPGHALILTLAFDPSAEDARFATLELRGSGWDRLEAAVVGTGLSKL